MEKLQLHKIKPDKKIVIHHFSLDMGQAWPRIMEMFDETRFANIELHIAMLVGEPTQLGVNVPKEVEHWCKDTSTSLQRIKDSLPDIETNGKLSKLIVKQYKELPFCHGFTLVEPLNISYISFCRWKSPTKYDWRDDNYLKIQKKTI
ncbi:hypothetical protein QUF74_17290 [Candidatus Halobeggiatoa sp. HSG11]|nr:hypothetical protein [Candidatus Halobeggiatoa sp. HSG11]